MALIANGLRDRWNSVAGPTDCWSPKKPVSRKILRASPETRVRDVRCRTEECLTVSGNPDRRASGGA
ncbi:Hypothetical protein CINCED_3A011385 [Cinara cedri]|uniref:Uncharacterized protein n=1 Tax=Cinara cedri TaxID=506608 RepID=A0A5E4NQ09_9HEMI|nr:Hypothetical protein CINCED_3A011385 [Cinara cedri]